jgi:hypothetical protein
MLKSFRKFIPFAKVEEQKDGSLYVYGLVTAQKPDQEDEVCDYESTKPYYQKLVTRYAKATSAVEGMDQSIAPLREMHQLKAVGCGKSIDFDDAAQTIHMGFKVVETEAVKKVKAGVLIGFSQGGDYVKTWKKGPHTWYTADPGEVSLVDSPCLEDALIQQLVEKTYTFVGENGSTELRKFQVKAKKADPVPACDGSLTREEKIERLSKAHKLVASAVQKGMYEVKTVADILSALNMTCSWLFAEKEFEGDDSEVPAKLQGILKQLADAFIELVQEETNELVAAAKVAKGANTMDKKELAKKLEQLEKGESVTFTKAELAAAVADGVIKAGKSVAEHLTKLASMHNDHHDAMSKCIEKCQKAVSGDGAEADKSSEVTMTKAEVEAAIAKAVDAAKKTSETTTPPAQPETFTKAQAEEMVAAAVEKALKDKGASAPQQTRAKLTLVGRDGKEIEKSEEVTAKPEAELSKSVGF